MNKLRFYCWGVLAAMIGVTTWASMDSNVIVGFQRMFADPWGVATLFDAYFGFLTFFVWVCYKETSTGARLAWFIAIMIFGNIAMAIYVLLAIRKLQPAGATFADLLTRKHS